MLKKNDRRLRQRLANGTNRRAVGDDDSDYVQAEKLAEAWRMERSARYLRLGTLRFALRARLYMRFIIYFQIESSHKFRAGEFENPRWRSAGWHWNRYVPSETIGSFHREKIARRGFVFDG